MLIPLLKKDRVRVSVLDLPFYQAFFNACLFALRSKRVRVLLESR